MASYTEAIYQGANDFLKPTYYTPPINYKPPAGELSMSLDPRTANQLGEVNAKINPGLKHIEVQGVTPGTWESVPEQHLDEINRLSKLVGFKPSLHGPVIEASGIGEKGWTEENRIGAEKQLESTLIRSKRLDPDGNISVTVHTTAQLPELRPHVRVEGKGGKVEQIQQGLWVVNEETGQFDMIKPETRYFPEETKPGEKTEFTGEQIKFETEKELKRRNEEIWTESISGINRSAEFGEQSLEGVRRRIIQAGPGQIIKEELPEKKKIAEKLISDVTKGMAGELNIDLIKKQGPEYKKLYDDVKRGITHSQIYLRDSYRSMKNLFDKAYSNAEGKDKEALEKFAKDIAPKITENIMTDPKKLEDLRKIVGEGLDVLSGVKQTPEMWKPLDEFVVKKSAETFANVVETAYNKFGSKAPILNIENPPAGFGLSTGEDLKKVVKNTRAQLVENFVKHKGMSRSQASEIAEKMIGATWDVGHINMLRKKGYTEKDIIEQTKIVAPFVKHVHLSDNFGLDHTELPMGMGNVPIKGMMDELKKAGFKGQKVIEAGNWWQYFAEHGGGNPFKPTVEAFDSPIYAMKEGAGWSETGKYGNYYLGHGPVNPPVHHNTYGAGFQNLPVELGGEMPGDRGRFAGTPNQ